MLSRCKIDPNTPFGPWVRTLQEAKLDTTRILLIRTLTMPGDANPRGGIFGGWILAQMDLAAGLLGMQRSSGACATVAIESVRFLEPLGIGETFSIYGTIQSVGRTSMRLELVGLASASLGAPTRKIVEGLFVSVAVDGDGRPRAVLSPPEAFADSKWVG